jgi:DNA-binding MarR family transcriptional regulator
VIDQTDLGYLLQQSAKLYRMRFADELRDRGLTPQQAAVLMAVASAPGTALSPGSVAEAIGADLATTTGLLQRLERDGWLVSAPNPGDGRSRLVSLTPASEQAVPALRACAAKVSARARDSLSAEGFDALVSLLQRLIAHEASSSANGTR